MVRKIFFLLAVLLPSGIALLATIWPAALWSLTVVAPVIALGVYDVLQRRHTLQRIYPVIGHGRYIMETLRPEIQQYFVESNLDGTPFSREFRSIVYQRAKSALDTQPFGTQRNVERVGYEWMNHSLAPKPALEEEPRVCVGGSDCAQPYLASHLNISAMSFGSLSNNAISALNRGARLGGFAHNTGEGGLTPYHLEPGGDLTWQIGTGYFGCRDADGSFDPVLFSENAQRDAVKMIEIKLSQGAKPGHGGILPAGKLTREIAQIRQVPLGRDVISPPTHAAFSNPTELLEFIARIRELAGGKPVGFKLCVGYPSEFLGICKAMVATSILPDFITVDGAEGGTGAAPLELTNSVGMPMRDGLLLVSAALTGVGVRDKIRIVVAGKITTAFHMFRAMALGADICNSARGMMLALGCIQARRCHTNTCPVGVATQDPARAKALDTGDKGERIARYHKATVRSFLELVSAAGLSHPNEIRPHHVLRRMEDLVIRDLSEIYSHATPGSFLDPNSTPDTWRVAWRAASPERF